MADNKSVPLGVLIIAVINVIEAIALIAVGAFCIVSASSIVDIARESGVTIDDIQGFETILAYFGGVCLVLSIISLIVAYGFIKGWSIMWIIGVILSIISIISSIIAIFMLVGVVGLLLNIIVLWYLFRPNVKQHFNV